MVNRLTADALTPINTNEYLPPTRRWVSWVSWFIVFALGSAIAAQVVNQGLDLFELSRSRASLEDVFINLTMEESDSTSVKVPVKDSLLPASADTSDDEEDGGPEMDAPAETAEISLTELGDDGEPSDAIFDREEPS